MKTIIRKVKAFIKATIAFNLAPYCVRNAYFGKEHFCWTWKEAVKYLKAYDAQKFGHTCIHGWNGDIIALKSAARKGN